MEQVEDCGDYHVFPIHPVLGRYMGRYGSCGLSRLIIFNTVNLSMNLLKMRFNLASIMVGTEIIS